MVFRLPDNRIMIGVSRLTTNHPTPIPDAGLPIHLFLFQPRIVFAFVGASRTIHHHAYVSSISKISLPFPSFLVPCRDPSPFSSPFSFSFYSVFSLLSSFSSLFFPFFSRRNATQVALVLRHDYHTICISSSSPPVHYFP